MRKKIETTKPTQVSVPGVRGLEASRDTPGHLGSVMDGLESVLGFLGCFLEAILGVLKLFGCILGIKMRQDCAKVTKHQTITLPAAIQSPCALTVGPNPHPNIA